MVQALPVLRLIKRHWPASEIHWWIDSRLAPLLEGDPDLAGVVRFERERWASLRHWPEIWRSIRWLREQDFDLVIDLQCLARSGAFAWLANGKLLVGLDEPREGARGFYDIIVPRAPFTPTPWIGISPCSQRWACRSIGISTGCRSARSRRGNQTEVASRMPRGGSSCSPARGGRTNAGPQRISPSWFASLARSHPDVRFAILGGEADRELGAVIARADPQRASI